MKFPSTALSGFWWPGSTMFTYDNFFLNKEYVCLQNKTLWSGYFFKRYFELGWKRYAKITDRYKKSALEELNIIYTLLYCYYNEYGQPVHHVKYEDHNSSVYNENNLTCLLNVYSNMDMSYIGIPEAAWYYYKKGLIGLQCLDEKYKGNPPYGETRTALLGYQPAERKWYGWARAIQGFGIGSVVRKGDIAYRSDSVLDIYKDLLNSYSVDELYATPTGVNVTMAEETHFVECGKGEWTAKTLTDAKEMARNFAAGCS